MEKTYTKRIKLFILVVVLIFNLFIFNYHNKTLKVAICTMAREENKYIKEFLDYYIKLGVDHIFIYDDNEKNTEKIRDVIDNKYKQYITIYDKQKDVIKNQSLAFTTCYNNNKYNFDWIFMIDIDEYLVIVNSQLKKYLSKHIFKKCDFIKIHWVQPTDNNLLYYDKRPLMKRFKGPYKEDTHIKTLIRGNIEALKYMIHSPLESPERNITCNNIGKKINYNKIHFQDVFDINIDKAYIIHYKYKSTEEYINKYKRGYHWENDDFMKMRIKEYFQDNKITLEKIEFMQKELNLNLSRYKIMIKKI